MRRRRRRRRRRKLGSSQIWKHDDDGLARMREQNMLYHPV